MHSYFTVVLLPHQRLQFRAWAASVGAQMAKRPSDGAVMFIVEGEQAQLDAYEQQVRISTSDYRRYNRPLPGFPVAAHQTHPVTPGNWDAYYSE